MDEDVAVRVRLETALVRNANAADRDEFTVTEPMGIESMSYPHRTPDLTAASRGHHVITVVNA